MYNFIIVMRFWSYLDVKSAIEPLNIIIIIVIIINFTFHCSWSFAVAPRA